MTDLPIKLISTDFDGTLFSESDRPSIPPVLLETIAELQNRGAKWVINTGREMSSLMESLAQAPIAVHPDFLILVEREIFRREAGRYVAVEPWNTNCHLEHQGLFARVQPEVPELMEWVNLNFRATVYNDPWSPFCLIAGTNGDADRIEAHLSKFCLRFPALTLVRNDVYARFCHVNYNKGTALAELSRLLNLTSDSVFAAGDHLNDLSMLRAEHARLLVAPLNAIPEIKALVRAQGGYVSRQPCGHGVLDGIQHYLMGTW